VKGEPCAKGRPRLATIAGRARSFTPEKTRTREGIVASLAHDAMAGRPPMTGPLCMSVLAVMGIPKSWSKKKQAAALAGIEQPTKKPDASNILKLFEDAMNEVVFVDDCQIVESRIRKIYGAIPQTIVEVTPDSAARAS